jgi:lipoate-protein ligase A
MAPWRFMDVEEHSGLDNMEVDEHLARRLLHGDGLPTVRLYTWRPWAISLGFNQDIAQIDVERARHDGIDVVRRPTGGRAVLHAEELTYSVVMVAEDKTVLAIYNAISRALVRGLRLFGVDVSFTKAQPDLREHYRSPSSIPCFTASARYEIEWEGRKLVGSAQRRLRSPNGRQEVVLQHGSILLGPAHKRLVEYLLLPDADARRLLTQELEQKTVDLSSLKGGEIALRELAACIRRGFEEEWVITFVQDESIETRKVMYG